MAQGFRIVWQVLSGEAKDVFEALEKPYAEAATKGMKKLQDYVKKGGRAEIKQGGFGIRWQNALRVDRFPTRAVSINSALWIWHKIPYAGVFETGAHITGKPLLWLPLSTMPKKIGGRRASVQSYIQSVGPLVKIERPGQPPLLIGKPPSGMRKGRTKAQRAAHSRFAQSEAAPLFIGVNSVNLRKHFGLHRFFEQAANRLVGYVAEEFREND